MYIVEKIIKLYLKYFKKEINSPNYLNVENNQQIDFVTCKHNFMPIDSTGKILACSKCGYVVTEKRLKKNHNFFKYQ